MIKKALLVLSLACALLVGMVAGGLFAPTRQAEAARSRPVAISAQGKNTFLVLWSTGDVWSCNEAWGKNCKKYPLRIRE